MGAIEWSALSAVFIAVLALGGVVVRLTDRLNKSEAAATAASTSAKTAAVSVHEAHQRIDKLLENGATNSDLRAVENRFTEAVNGMRSDFQHMASRLDTLLAGLMNRPTS